MQFKPSEVSTKDRVKPDPLDQRISVAYLVSQPIQYQAPLLRRISALPDIDLTVFFRTDTSVRRYHDAGFGRAIQWDVPLLDGYRHEFLTVTGTDGKPSDVRLRQRHLIDLLRSRRFDVLWVHGFSGRDNLRIIFAAWRASVPVLIRDEATAISRERTWLRKLAKRIFFGILSQVCDAFLAIGSLNRDYYIASGIDSSRIFMMPYAVDNAYFSRLGEAAAYRRDTFRRELGLESGRPVILFASKFEKRKRAEDLLTAFEILCTGKRLAARPYLLFVGDGEMRADLEARAKPLSDDVRFLGFRNQSELPAFYDLCDVFVLPSVAEPWGLVVNEVMSVGRAIVVDSEVGCAHDLVRDGVNGYVVPPRDPRALAVALEQALADPAHTMELGRASREIIGTWSFDQDIDGLRAAIAACRAGAYRP